MTVGQATKRFFGLILLYSLVIFGIFIIQFRSEQTFSQTFGSLKITLRKNSDNSTDTILKNYFQIVHKGITFFSDGTNPVILNTRNRQSVALALQQFLPSENRLGFTLQFNENVSLEFTQFGNPDSKSFTIQANLPAEAGSLTVPYRIQGGYIPENTDDNAVTLSSKNEIFQLAGIAVSAANCTFTPAAKTAQYAPYTPKAYFAFEDITNTTHGDETEYADVIKQYKTDFVSSVQLNSGSTVERDITAYIAEMFSQNNYQNGLSAVPPAFKTDNRRSYLSVPYFGSLAALNNSLIMYINNITNRLTQAVQQTKLDVFEIDKLASLLLIQPDERLITGVLSIPSAIPQFNPTSVQAAGILQTRTRLHSTGNKHASLLDPFVQACLDTIEQNSRMENGYLYVYENEVKLPPLRIIKIAEALREYGISTQNKDIEKTGNALIVSLFSTEKEHINYADVYPILANNPEYPHIAILSTGLANPVWAWTCATNIRYSTDRNKTISLQVHFKQGESHYVIIRGIEPFERIEMYGLNYRSDPAFESYNSSGYIYQAQTKTLLLKVRHKTDIELIRLFYQSAVPNTEPEPVSE